MTGSDSEDIDVMDVCSSYPELETSVRILSVEGSISIRLPALFFISICPYYWSSAFMVVTITLPPPPEARKLELRVLNNYSFFTYICNDNV